MFSGDIRGNLDPFGSHPDEALWEALGSVSLRGTVEGMEGGLQVGGGAAVLGGGEGGVWGSRWREWRGGLHVGAVGAGGW